MAFMQITTARVSPVQLDPHHHHHHLQQPNSMTVNTSGQTTDSVSEPVDYPKLPQNSAELQFTQVLGHSLAPIKGTIGNLATMSNSMPDSSGKQSDDQHSNNANVGKMDQVRAVVTQLPSRVGSWTEFFDPKLFNIPSLGSELAARFRGNLSAYYANYAIISLILLAYCLITSPLLLIATVCVILVAYSILNRNHDVKLFGQSLNSNQQLIALSICSIPLFLLLGLTGIFFWLVGASTCLVVLHCIFHQPPQLQNYDAQVEAMESGLSGNLHHDGDQHQSTKNESSSFQVISL